ncbi:FtsX-like permease family protein [Mucilaginibacter robiniae]|uniref:FtsX-like permease family protein n=1 Tax=Mucilaginibacter robiniae TaxID=2728022 RepID=A0A7L5EB58_9SPHI|nr:ABC transporter permease [Mucilaginibacter robiniae]QJD98183.1 FtsX-like permease family protein [Mucilaginibacter robiniae]
MLRNNIKIAWRNLKAKKFFTFLNVIGLAVAISCCTLIYLYISYNLSFDSYHKQSQNIFRLVTELHLEKEEYEKGSSYAEYKALKTETSQVMQAAFAVDGQSFIINVSGNSNKRFKEEKNTTFITSDWFKLFSYKWLAGSAKQLDKPSMVVLRQKIALKYFGSTHVVGKVLSINNQLITIAGVVADEPYNTDLKSDLYLSLSSLRSLIPLYDKNFYTDWGYINSTNAGFIQLHDANQKDAVEEQIIELAKKHAWGDGLKYFTFKLLPLKDIHFDVRYGGTVQQILLLNLLIIGLLIITIAIINYINLVVAQQTQRGTEIATRKVLGGSARHIFTQFMVEALLSCVIALIVAGLMVLWMLPAVNHWLFTDEPVHILSYTNLCLFIGLLLLAITIGTGIYPALVLSRVSIAQALKNNVFNLPVSLGRKILVGFQNTITQILIICTIIIIAQVHFLKSTDIGFDRQLIVTMPLGQLSASQKEQWRERLHQMPAVQSFSFCNNAPASNSQRGATVQFDNRSKWESWPARFAIGDSAYCHTFGLHLIAGRNMRNSQPTPEFLINETMASKLAGKNKFDVVGKKLTAGDVKGVIVGVVKDFNVKSLIEPIEPSIILETDFLQTNLAVKLSGNQLSTTLTTLQKEYERILPDQVFSYQFIDEQIAKLYKKENIQQKLIWASAIVAIGISSVGLLGLISLIVLQRTKEIGIRKILGASVAQISLLLSQDFLGMVLLAFLIACPISWWLMNKWLQNFAYHIHLSWWFFVLAGSIASLIVATIIGFQSIKAAITNPVKSLRSE